MNNYKTEYLYDELYHHGVKGQKWGVRRYQKANGSLTNAGKKRLAKNEAYRNKLANKASKKADKHKRGYEEAKMNIADLKKNGTSSKAYKNWKAEQDSEREWKYENDNSVSVNGKTYKKKYSESWEKLGNDWLDSANSKQKVRDLISENTWAAKDHKDAAKRWVNSNSNLMNMEVSALTTKRDIKRMYKG